MDPRIHPRTGGLCPEGIGEDGGTEIGEVEMLEVRTLEALHSTGNGARCDPVSEVQREFIRPGIISAAGYKSQSEAYCVPLRDASRSWVSIRSFLPSSNEITAS